MGQLTVAAMRTAADLECAFSMPNTGPVRNVSYSKQIKVGWSSGFGRGLLREEGSSTVRRARARPAFDPQLALSLDYFLLDYPLDNWTSAFNLDLTFNRSDYQPHTWTG